MTHKELISEHAVNFKITTCDFEINDLLNTRLDFDVFLPSKGFCLQRKHVWTIEQKQELIMSILLKRSISKLAIILHYPTDGGIEVDKIEVIDGKQRLSAIIDFLENKFPISIKGKAVFFKDLDKSFHTFCKLLSLPCDIARAYENDDINDADKIAWFNIINFAGTPQDAEHKAKLLS